MTINKCERKEIILYIVFGVLTVVINMVSYAILYDLLRISNVSSTCLSWGIAVCFAFCTNKGYVFHSQQTSKSMFVREIILFILCRFFTCLLDILIMVITVDYLLLKALPCKFISNIIVTIINYVVSKFYIFKSK